MPYQKIISLIPSLTELLIDFGLADKLAGRTRFCIHPADSVKEIPIIGGPKNPNHEKIKAIKPDFILANKEENRKEDIERLAADFHVHLTEINTIPDALQTITELGEVFGVAEKAKILTGEVENLLGQKPETEPVRTAYFIWKKPWMVAAPDTYVNEVLKEWNLANVFADKSRYPEITLDELRVKSPELIILSSEPYPFKEKHIADIIEYCPEARFELLDGEWFSWYGSRMVPSFKALNAWRETI